jgi:CRISPR-associated endonuclease/helicase Cas3
MVESLRNAPMPDLNSLRQLQPYTTNVHVSALRNPGVAALMRPILGTEVRRGALVEWRGGYDTDTGIELDPKLEEFLV